jgi:hypothetical protein
MCVYLSFNGLGVNCVSFILKKVIYANPRSFPVIDVTVSTIVLLEMGPNLTFLST